MSIPTGTSPEAGGSFAFCAWHEGYDRTARLVRLPEDQGTGPCGPSGKFACFSCRDAYDLVPVADQS
ncbi:hypothetical protein [Streptomyces ipomoeae]|uniref:hypothetical protein n=1 Tax=Streptomyces ipomoeae TaxID=103232 RepID=UPI0011472E72|nr:hypothetical protein [Streptomyces ipomoeae]TQE19903.1 hypothetical protein Sipo7851_43275 [Streptomyces ipomoeae]